MTNGVFAMSKAESTKYFDSRQRALCKLARELPHFSNTIHIFTYYFARFGRFACFRLARFVSLFRGVLVHDLIVGLVLVASLRLNES